MVGGRIRGVRSALIRLITVSAAAVAVLALAAPVPAARQEGYAASVVDAATGGAGQASVVTSEVAVDGGLVTNSSFEEGTSGWNMSGSDAGVALTRVAGGHSGAWGARLSNGGASGATCMLNDAPNWVTTTDAGRYTASLWVRSDAA